MGYNRYLSILLIAITFCLLYIAYLAWRKRELPSALSLSIGMCAGACYAFGYAFELISTNLDQIRFWLRIEYIGISFGTYMWFIMVLQYTNHRAALRKWILALLAIIPVLTLISEYTNSWHHLFYKSLAISRTEGFPLASATPGPLYFLHVIYAYSLVVIGMILLFRMYRRASVHIKKQVAFIIIGSCGPYAITLIYLSGILEWPIDVSPFGFLFSGIFFTWGIYQFNMMKLVPQALKKVFNSMEGAVIVLDLDYSITSYNESARLIFKQLNERKAVGQPVTRILSPYPELISAIKQGEPVSEKIKIGQTGPRYYQVNISAVYDRKRSLIGKMVLLNDITEAVLTEERLLANSKQLSELNKFKDRIFKVIAHDIRDPLSILISLMELLKEEMQACGDKHDEITREMEQQIQNTFSIAESLLDWFRNQSGGLLFHPMEWNLSQATQRTVALLQIQSDRKRIQVNSDIPDHLMVYADKEMLDLIIRNLLSNAIKFTDYEGTIHLHAEQAEGQTVMSIKDTGQGMAPDQAHELLQNRCFYSTSQGTAGEKGIGLGLTLCKEFVRINGGDMWFESTPDQGSIFYFSAPTAQGIPAHPIEPAKRRSTG